MKFRVINLYGWQAVESDIPMVFAGYELPPPPVKPTTLLKAASGENSPKLDIKIVKNPWLLVITPEG
jgi:hypothetical protein